MNLQKNTLVLFTILVMAILLAGGSATYITYRTAIDEEANRLRETVQSQARLLESVARFDLKNNTDFPEGAEQATLSQIREAHSKYRGFGDTGEFTLAKRKGDDIVFLLSHRHHDLANPRPVPFDSPYAEPMRKALQGFSGTVVGLDYRGELVLAAYEPVDVLGFGIVAKIDLAEIQAPFLRAFVFAILLGAGVIAVAAFFLFRITNPWVKAVQGAELRYRSIFNQAAVGIARISPEGSWLEVNQKLCDIVGYTRGELLIRTFQDVTHPDDLDEGIELMRQLLAKERDTYSMEKRYVQKSGYVVWINLTVSLVRNLSGVPDYFIAVVENITERKELEAKLTHMAIYDALTGLYNRKELERRVNDELQRALRYQHSLSIFLMDLDHFKQINDQHGHVVGDRVLQNFAALLRNSIRKIDQAARYGGEEFVLVLPETTLVEAEEMAERLRNRIAEHEISIGENRALKITASIGVATCPDHGESWEKLIGSADAAMYKAKNAGRNLVQTASRQPVSLY